ncbi:MAG: VRR-NUC domain-containing protein [Burkholderia gladioli]
MRESEIENYLVARVKALGGEVRKVRWIGRRGAPDRLVMLPARPCVWVELKAPDEKPKPHQQREHDRMRGMGQVVVVVDSLEGVDGVLA